MCLCFIAYEIYTEPVCIISSLRMDLSVDTLQKIAKVITTIRLRLPLNDEIITRTMLLSDQHRSLHFLFDHPGV